ncbi:chemotaxis protein CheA [Marinomonas mediterranea]|uniref:Chemotaxis protein CheA n=1 Tax=Marinomonas mediterranea (strain ATCC 700492 / JCM 21426 / NBRC 103028 / MMB-1) TaxID=717774 RepID=F2JTV4_MARM1|nr:chemotaxis protein CheA [Marinomonas mediterranea]ADZ90375.1 CheA signal transduction histidine kinase [Marinomonas mediterranea MMB-1]WCN16557.1 chemotaxis protein CheA [Marinomonas mediterranea MMB-1]
MDDMNQFTEIFFEEAQEHIDAMETLLLAFDIEEPDIEELNSIFRAAHSIKGGSGTFGLHAMTGVTHVMENILDSARNETLKLDDLLITVLLETVDVLKNILDAYRFSSDIDYPEIETAKAKLEQELERVSGSSSDNVSNTIPSNIAPSNTAPSNTDSGALDSSDSSINKELEDDDAFGFFDQTLEDSEDPGFGLFEPLLAQSKDNSEEHQGVDSHNSEDAEFEDVCYGFFNEITEEEAKKKPSSHDDSATDIENGESKGYGFFEKVDEQPLSSDQEAYGFFDNLNDSSANHDVSAPNSSNSQQASTASTPPSAPVSKGVKNQENVKQSKNTGEATSIRVETTKVDKLVNLVGELVITQSMLKLIGNDVQDSLLEKMQIAIAELERNTREIQEAVMSVRMLPISTVFNRFPRLVRDLSKKLDKQIELVVEGGATEIDKNLIEKISDPLTHLIRNSVDHGIELPHEREEKGKPAKGLVTLSASQRGGEIVIEIRDDGGGLNKEKILQKAVENNVSLPDPLTDSAVWGLIFAPGFSTASEVTDVSGRGVGMDVVRKNIESLGGRVDIFSEDNVGTKFQISLPLTLAILDGMCIRSAEQVFVLPLTNIVESLQPESSQIRIMKNKPLLWVREEYWPLVDLGHVLADEEPAKDLTEHIVVLVEAANNRFGLVVEGLLGQQQVVIKSLERHYKRVQGVAGATIMGDGSVALILDADSLTGFVSQPTPEERAYVIN